MFRLIMFRFCPHRVKHGQMRFEVRPIQYPHVTNGVVYGVYRVGAAAQAPLFVIAPSAALLRRGLQQLGVYAGIDFPSNMNVGAYEGNVMGTFDKPHEAASSREAARQEHRGNTMMLICKNKQGKYDLIDGRGCGPPYLSLCNDPRGTTLKSNLRSTDFGTFYTTNKIPSFDLSRSIYANGASELLWEYGNSFWRPRSKRTANRA